MKALIRYTKQDIEFFIKEREPFFKIWECFLDAGRGILTASTVIYSEECEGHFPGKTYVPLIRISERMAQTGLVLVGVLTKEAMERTPIAIGHGVGAALSKRFPRPELDLRLEAREASCLSPLVLFQKIKTAIFLQKKCFVIDILAHGKWGKMDQFTPVASLRVYYILIDVPRQND